MCDGSEAFAPPLSAVEAFDEYKPPFVLKDRIDGPSHRVSHITSVIETIDT